MSQNGGTKIIIKDSEGRDIVVKKIEKEQFFDIFKDTISIEILSISSLQGLILRLTLPEETTPFRSDIFSESDDLLTSANYMDITTGKRLTQHILKCCVIGPPDSKKNMNIDSYDHYKKTTISLKDFEREFDAQAYTYTASMAYGGFPICPDVSALMTFTPEEFEKTFFKNDKMPEIFTRNNVFKYLRRTRLPIGILLMESLPNVYENLAILFLDIKQNPDNIILPPIAEKMSEYVLTLLVLIFYRAGIIPLDAHLNNWMYIPESKWVPLPIETRQNLNLSRVKAIDFGNIIFRRGFSNLEEIKNITRDFFDLYNKSRSDRLTQFAMVMNADPAKITTSNDAAELMVDLINNINIIINGNQNGRLFFIEEPDSSIPEIFRGINLIHTILLIVALIDSFYNTKSNYGFGNTKYGFQLVGIYRKIFYNHFDDVSSIFKYVNINLNTYLLSSTLSSSHRTSIILNYTHIQQLLSEYLSIAERGEFPNLNEEPLDHDIISQE
jgi:hypothetical protein